jgi:hypothetical protein
MVQGCRREARQSPCIQAQRSNAHAERRRRSAGDSEAARPCVDRHDGNLYRRGDSEGEDGAREHASAGLRAPVFVSLAPFHGGCP